MFDLYMINDWNGKTHLMSSKRIYERVTNDSSKPNYKWITSSREIYKVCSKKGFPKDKSLNIKALILNCYSKTIFEQDELRENNDINTIYLIFNSLYNNKSKDVKEARNKFLNAYLISIINSSMLYLFHFGKEFKKETKKWKKYTFKKLIKNENLDLDKLYNILQNDYCCKMEELENKGVFDIKDFYMENELNDYIQESIDNFFNYFGENKKIKKLVK